MDLAMIRNYWILILALLWTSNAMSQDARVAEPELKNKDSWTMVILPDPQSYVKFGRNQGILELMTAWMVEQKDNLNINMMVCTGDLVNRNNILVGDGKNDNQSSINQWRALDNAISRLDNRIPYVLAAGNHDYGYWDSENRHTQYDTYVTADRNHLNEAILREYYFSADGMPTLANAAFEFEGHNKQKYLILNLEFAPRDEVLEWAKKAIGQEKYKDHRVIALTHSYMNNKNERIEKENYPLKDANYGQAMWEKLINPSHNIVMVIAGHIGDPNNFKGDVAFKQEYKEDGKLVTQMVFNAQARGGGWNGNGGDGWLRYLEFDPDGQTVHVKTYSPFFGISPSTKDKAWRTDDYDEFSFQLED